MLALPAEILDYIFSFLQSDIATLKACSQGLPILSPLIERHIYTNVTVQDNHYDELITVLHDRPYTADYIRALKIIFSNSIDLIKLSPILPKLLMLRRIELDNAGTTSEWQRLPENFRLAFLDCLRLPSLMDISISMAFPLSILSHCKHIRHLSLKFYWHEGSAPMAEDIACLPAIDSLALDNCMWKYFPSTVSAISSWMESCHLSSLEFSDAITQTPDFNALHQILISCSHSLTNLNVNIDTRYGSIYGFNRVAFHSNDAIPIPLSNLRKLQRLIIRARLFHLNNSSPSRNIYSPVFAIAGVLKFARPLKRLILDLESSEFKYHDCNDAEGQITNALCDPLHSLLVQSSSTIDSIHLRFTSRITHRDSTSSSVIISILAGHSGLMQFVENGKLILAE